MALKSAKRKTKSSDLFRVDCSNDPTYAFTILQPAVFCQRQDYRHLKPRKQFWGGQ